MDTSIIIDRTIFVFNIKAAECKDNPKVFAEVINKGTLDTDLDLTINPITTLPTTPAAVIFTTSGC